MSNPCQHDPKGIRNGKPHSRKDRCGLALDVLINPSPDDRIGRHGSPLGYIVAHSAFPARDEMASSTHTSGGTGWDRNGAMASVKP